MMDQACATTDQGRRTSLLGYASTAAVAVGNITATVVVAGLLARSWSTTDFLLYNSCNRYLSVLFCVSSFSLGYGLVRYGVGRPAANAARVLPTAIVTCLGLCLVVFVALFFAADPICRFLHVPTSHARLAIGLTFVWVIGQSALHIVLAHLRSTRQITLANLVHIGAKGAAVLAMSLFVWQFAGVPVYGYYAGVGLLVAACCAVAMCRQRAPLSWRFDVRLSREMIGFSWSRFLDSLLKHFSGVALLTILFGLGYTLLAGQFALVQTLLRGLEAICQPLVMLIFADYLRSPSKDAARRQIQGMWNVIVAGSVVVIPIAFLAGQPLLGLWLGGDYRSLGWEFSIAAVGFAPAVGIVLLRGYLDAQYRFSPIAVLNALSAIGIISAALAMYATGNLNLINLVLLFALSRWVQLASVYWMLRRSHALKLFDWSEAKSSVQQTFARLAKRLSRREHSGSHP